MLSSRTPLRFPLETRLGDASARQAGHEFRVVTWNLGYGGLSAGADFIRDGGKRLRGASRDQITLSAREIADFLAHADMDIAFVQEMAHAGFLTRGVPLREIVEESLPNTASAFQTDIVFPRGGRFLKHGHGIYSRIPMHGFRAEPLAAPPSGFSMLKRSYTAISGLVHSASGDKWLFLTMHLPAFDKNGAARTAQAAKLIDVAKTAFADGYHVVIGGDWNMQLHDREFPHSTPERHMFWVNALPEDLVPEGWNLGVDSRTPTVRTLHAPYVEGETFTTIVDGFVVSPNVRVVDVTTANLSFKNSDHNPVIGRFTTAKFPLIS